MSWDYCINTAIDEVGGDVSKAFDIAVSALLKGFHAFSGLTVYQLAAEAGILLAHAGKIERAVSIAEDELHKTPAMWDAAWVYAAAAKAVGGSGSSYARDIVRRAARIAEPLEVFECDGPCPAVIDLLEALAEEGLLDLVPEVAAVVSPVAREEIEDWQSHPGRAVPLGAPEEIDMRAADDAPRRLADEGNFRRAFEAALQGENSYICMANFAAVAKAAHRRNDADTVIAALEHGLDLLVGSFGDEGHRMLIYHEEVRFRAAHGLGAVARILLPRAAAENFVQSAINHTVELNDDTSGGALLVAAAEAVMPSGTSLH